MQNIQSLKNLPELLTGTKSKTYIILSFMVTLMVPIGMILGFRFSSFFLIIINFVVFFSLIFSVYQNANFQGEKNLPNQKEGRVIILLFLVFLAPVIIITIKILAVNLSYNFVTNTSPQNLPQLQSSQIVDEILSAITASWEESWRLSMMTSTLMTFKIIAKPIWESKFVRWFGLLVTLLLSSFVFGWMHTFNYSDSWFNVDITIVLSVTGLVYGVFLLLTRNLFLLMYTHALWDVSNVMARSGKTIWGNYVFLVLTAVIIAIGFIFLLLVKSKSFLKSKVS